MANQGLRRPYTVRRRPTTDRNPEEPIKIETHDKNLFCEPSTQQEVRLVLLGKTGAGKSATGNTILCDECFNADLSMGSVTKECKRERRTVEGRDLVLVDTPGLFDTDLTTQQLQQELIHCLTLCSPGPHAYIKEEEENEKRIPDRLRRSQASLETEQGNIGRLEREERERMKQEEKEKMNLELWIEEEQQRRKSLKTKDDSYYTRMIVYLSLLLLGMGVGFAPALLAFLFPAAPVVAEAGIAAQILLQMLNLLGKGAAFIPVLARVATLPSCIIQ